MDLSRCSKCKTRLTAMTGGTGRTSLVCLRCDAVDPMKTDAAKWAESSLVPPTDPEIGEVGVRSRGFLAFHRRTPTSVS